MMAWLVRLLSEIGEAHRGPLSWPCSTTRLFNRNLPDGLSALDAYLTWTAEENNLPVETPICTTLFNAFNGCPAASAFMLLLA